MEFGRYRILSQLGQGGMATVYLGEDPMLNRLVAIKVIQAHLSSNSSLIDRFTVEAKTIAALRHVNIVEVFDFGVQENQQFLVMEYIDGQNLQMLCTAMAGSSMPNTVVAAIICQAAEGLTSAEKHGVVHRDIKPENLLFNSEGILKIADFGIAHIADEQSRTQTGAVLGSPNFMSPEQIEGLKPSNKTDLFSLGGVFYYCMTGKLPFTGPSIPVTMRNICDRPHPSILTLNPGADPFLVQLIDTLLQKDPATRGEGARWLSNQLRGWLNRHDVVDIVEHVRSFIGGLGLQTTHTIIESPGTGSRHGRPGTKSGTGSGRASSFSQPSHQTVSRPMTTLVGPGSGGGSTYSNQPTTGAMGPSSRSPLVWVGAFLAVAVLVLAGAVFFTTRSSEEKPVVVATPKPLPPPVAAVTPVEKPAPVEVKTPVVAPVEDPLSTEPEVHSVKRVSSQHPRYESHATTRVREEPRQIQRPKVPETGSASSPIAEAPRTGMVLIKSAPPFAALTINGKPAGETPMSAPMEVPVGKCHIEIVHRLTPPFDTVITVSPGSRQEFKFKLDR